jgi:hypothetical protein
MFCAPLSNARAHPGKRFALPQGQIEMPFASAV